MVFSSTEFLFLYLPALLVLYYLLGYGGRGRKNAILLIFSIGFYAWGEPLFVFLMFFSIGVNWFLVLMMEKSKAGKKRWMSAAIIYDILLIGIFKYASFISQNIALLTGNENLIVKISLPIGISFYTFQLMSYVLDVYNGTASAQKNPMHLMLYIALFPQLIAGPIVRYSQIEREIQHRQESFSGIVEGMSRFVYGLAKKVLLANYLARIADNTFDYLHTPSVMTAWLGVIAYAMQIYFDFSGYSDMAIGLGRIFGFHFAENFNYPYMACSVADFWRRWHISLSTWFRDYVYIPLGGNRVGKRRWLQNMLIVWTLTGIWHGANWTFVVWGLIYFAALLFEKQTRLHRIGWLSRIYTFLVVTLAWVFFRCESVSDACRYIGYLFAVGNEGLWDDVFFSYVHQTYVILILSGLGITPLISRFFAKLKKTGYFWVEQIWNLIIFIASLLIAIQGTYDPFIYFNF